MPLRFDNRVAVITGAGGGLGRAYAVLLGKLGAKVVVNDLGGGLTGGTSGSKRPADLVVDEIRRHGGAAVANYDSVEYGDKIINTAITSFQRVDILVNNAGILRDKSFVNMTVEDWDMIMMVHLKGAFLCTKAAWIYMIKQGFGRIINISSASGLFGNYGQANYSAAKAALIGFTKGIAAEGARKNVFANVVAPISGTRMTATFLPHEMVAALKPEFVAPVVAYLAHEKCKDNGEIIECGGGWVAKIRYQRTKGKMLPQGFGPDDVEREWLTISDFSRDVTYPTNLQESLTMVTQSLETATPTSATAKSVTPSPADKVFSLMGSYLQSHGGKKGEELVRSVGSTYVWDILDKRNGSVTTQWTIDLRSGSGSVNKGKIADADATLTIPESDFISICLGKLNPSIAFMQGKMKIKGNMRSAQKFTPDLFPKIHPEILELSVEDAIKKYLSAQQSKL